MVLNHLLSPPVPGGNPLSNIVFILVLLHKHLLQQRNENPIFFRFEILRSLFCPHQFRELGKMRFVVEGGKCAIVMGRIRRIYAEKAENGIMRNNAEIRAKMWIA